MKLTYSVTIDDLILFNEYHSEHSPFVQRARRKYRLLSPPSMLFVFCLVGFVTKSWTYPIVGAVVASAYAATTPRRFRKQIRNAAERCYKEGENKGLFGLHTLEILDTELLETNPSGNQSIKWAGIERVVSTPTHGYIYVSSNSAHVVPKASVTEGDYNAFMEAVRDRTTKQNPQQGVAPYVAQSAPSGER